MQGVGVDGRPESFELKEPACHAVHRIRSRTQEPRRVLGAGIQALGRKITAALTVRAERRALMALDESALKDMGFNRGQAQCEANRTFWDVPVDRLRW